MYLKQIIKNIKCKIAAIRLKKRYGKRILNEIRLTYLTTKYLEENQPKHPNFNDMIEIHFGEKK